MGIQVGLELNLTVLPWILATMKKCNFNRSRSMLAYVEKIGGLLYNSRHLSDFNLNLDAYVGIFWRLGFLRFEKLGPPFHIQLLNESFELLFGANIEDLQDRSKKPLINWIPNILMILHHIDQKLLLIRIP